MLNVRGLLQPAEDAAWVEIVTMLHWSYGWSSVKGTVVPLLIGEEEIAIFMYRPVFKYDEWVVRLRYVSDFKIKQNVVVVEGYIFM